jgi:hypothetical protein
VAAETRQPPEKGAEAGFVPHEIDRDPCGFDAEDVDRPVSGPLVGDPSQR